MSPESRAHRLWETGPKRGRCNLGKWPLDGSTRPHLLVLPATSPAATRLRPALTLLPLVMVSLCCLHSSPASVYSCLPRGENPHNQYYSGTNCNVIFFFWTQSGEIKKATAAEIQIQGSCYNGWYHPKYRKQHRLYSLFSVRCL